MREWRLCFEFLNLRSEPRAHCLLDVRRIARPAEGRERISAIIQRNMMAGNGFASLLGWNEMHEPALGARMLFDRQPMVEAAGRILENGTLLPSVPLVFVEKEG